MVSFRVSYSGFREAVSWFYYEYIYEPLMIIWRNTKARIGLITIMIYVVMAILGWLIDMGHLIKFNPLGNPALAWHPPCLKHPLGCDYMGRDLLVMIMRGARFILAVSFLRGLFVVVLGMLIGITAGYVGGKVDAVLTGLTDIILPIPSMVLYIVLATFIKSSNPIVIAGILSVTAWAGLARSIRSEVLSIKTAPYIEAAKTLGMPTTYIVFSEITPNLMTYITINYIWSTADAIYAMVGLFFLGVLPFREENWGVMLFEAHRYMGALYSLRTLHFVLAPILAIIGLQFGLILFSYAMDEIFNPRIRTEYFKTLRRRRVPKVSKGGK